MGEKGGGESLLWTRVDKFPVTFGENRAVFEGRALMDRRSLPSSLKINGLGIGYQSVKVNRIIGEKLGT